MLEGACHCGAIGWAADFEPDYLVSCTCSLCHRYGALWAHGTEATVRLRGTQTACATYVHGDGMIRFCFCKNCGCVTHYASRPGGTPEARVSVNMRMTGPKVVERFRIRTFDGAESWAFLD